MFSHVDLAKSKLVMVLVVQYVHQIGIERVNILRVVFSSLHSSGGSIRHNYYF